MTDEELALWDEAARADRAKSLLEDDLLSTAFEELEKEYVEGLLKAPARDVDGVLRLRDAVNILHRVKAHLEEHVNTGKLAKRRLDDIKQAGEAKRFRII